MKNKKMMEERRKIVDREVRREMSNRIKDMEADVKRDGVWTRRGGHRQRSTRKKWRTECRN